MLKGIIYMYNRILCPGNHPLPCQMTEETHLEKVETGCLFSGLRDTRLGAISEMGFEVEKLTHPIRSVLAPCPGGSQNTGRETYILQEENWRIPF